MNEFDYLAKAKNKMEKEKYREVISLCDKALKLNEDLPAAYSYRGNAHYELGEYDVAADDFSQAIKREPEDDEHYYDRSWSYCALKRYEDAVIDISKALEIDPKSSLYYFDKARFEYWIGRYKEAAVDFTKGIDLKPTENKYLCRGDCYAKLEEYSFALSDYNAALEINPKFSCAYFSRGKLYKKIEQLKKAERDFRKAVKLSPKYEEAIIELGLLKINLGKNDAMKYFNKAIKLNPNAENYCLKIEARQKILAREDFIAKISANQFVKCDCDELTIYSEEQAKEDVKDLNKAIALNPSDVSLYRIRAIRYLYLEDFKNALEDYNFLIENEPDDACHYAIRAFCKVHAGLYKDALCDCEKSTALNSETKNIIIFKTRALANYKLYRYEKALHDFRLVLNFKQESKIFYYLGLINYKLNNFMQAYNDFEKALELKPDIENSQEEKIPFIIRIFLNMGKNNEPIGLSQI